MHQLGVYTYIIAVGFVTAGILSSFMQLVSGRPSRFNLMPDSFSQALGGVVFGVMAGPAIVMRNAWLGMFIEKRPPFWFGLSTLIAGVWSLFLGCILLTVVFSF